MPAIASTTIANRQSIICSLRPVRGTSQDRREDACRWAPGVHLDRATSAPPARPAAADRVPAVTIGPTSRAQDAVACLHATIAEAERVTGLDDLRDDRGLMDIVDPDEYVLGQVPAPIAVVTDNGPWFRGEDPLLGTSAPGPLTPDQRRRRTVLRLPEARTPLPCRHRRRRRPRRRGPPLFAPLQHDPAAPGAGRVHQKVFERNPGGAVGSGLRCS